MLKTAWFLLFERSEFLIDTSQKKSLRVCTCARVSLCPCVRLILVLVCGIMYHIRTYLVSARYQPTTKMRICRYVCTRVGYVLCTTYVRTWYEHVCSWYQPAPKIRIQYVDTYVPGLHPKKKKEQNAQHTLRERHKHSATLIAQQGARNNCGQRFGGCSCCLMDKVAHDGTSVWVD